ncbi:hypothetical protein KSF_104210 [Reticulibacter mediterranei]|uniref:Uncharacterized protein n=1 Tax=Reticulibacter mediterranei TaxID=2778369 RepID=A0A8J3N947_9CHLR|nr:hypothetical protein [Reticulibacter mediterranei]GHP00374.1 hypothetical protein KSF_104210 [Reticulibacter mediterranei]
MRFHLLTVESSQHFGDQLHVLPRVPISGLIERKPNMLMPMPGEGLELSLPDGRILHATIASFGVEGWASLDQLYAAEGGSGKEVWKVEGNDFYTTSDPSNPVLTLTIAGDLRPEDVPPGTEIWLSEARYQTSAPADTHDTAFGDS